MANISRWTKKFQADRKFSRPVWIYPRQPGKEKGFSKNFKAKECLRICGLAMKKSCRKKALDLRKRTELSWFHSFCLHFRVGGVLIPTRSFGDFLLKSEHEKPPWKQVISVVPQIQTFHLDNQWDFIVVGSDGVWDAMSNVDLVTYVRQRLNAHSSNRDKLVLSQLCEQILDMCCAKTVGRYGKNSCDNMTIIIIWFDHGQPGGDKSDTGSSVVSSCVSR